MLTWIWWVASILARKINNFKIKFLQPENLEGGCTPNHFTISAYTK